MRSNPVRADFSPVRAEWLVVVKKITVFHYLYKIHALLGMLYSIKLLQL